MSADTLYNCSTRLNIIIRELNKSPPPKKNKRKPQVKAARTLILSGVLRICITEEALRDGAKCQVLIHWPFKEALDSRNHLGGLSASGV